MRRGLPTRPLLIAVALGLCGAALSAAEPSAEMVPAMPPLWRAQITLGAVGGGAITITIIVLIGLLMTPACTRCSRLVLTGLAHDHGTQWTLGIFVGTFLYCLAAQPVAPLATVGAVLLALLCVCSLLFFAHHVANAFTVNFVVDRIARETETVIDRLMPHPRPDRGPVAETAVTHSEPEIPILNEVSGYIRWIDTERLVAMARRHDLRVRVARAVGHFVPAGVPLLMVSSQSSLDRRHIADLVATVDLGPVRSLQQDVEFGVIQIVDIALRALSPAVNDPSTAINCVDQLTRILIRWTDRAPPDTLLFSPPEVLRVTLPWIDLGGLLDTAVEQIRAHGASDAAVSLRLLRLLHDLTATVGDVALQRSLAERGVRVVEGCRNQLPPDDVARLEQRHAAILQLCTGAVGGEAA